MALRAQRRSALTGDLLDVNQRSHKQWKEAILTTYLLHNGFVSLQVEAGFGLTKVDPSLTLPETIVI